MIERMKKRLYITLYPDTIEKLEIISKEMNRSKSAMIEKLIAEYKLN
jgi:Ribbon-helix-helix protein, copG family.